MEQHTMDIEETEALADEAACNFKVHEGLRKANKEAYTPILISVGPYHRGQPKPLAMEKRKEHYLELLLQRNNNLRKEDYLDSMKKLEERARKYYADPVDHLNGDEFFRVRKGEHQQSHVGDEVKVSWKRIQICNDLMLLENQLPFFIISEFYDMSYDMIVTQNPNQIHHDPTSTSTLTKLAMLPILEKLPGGIDFSKIDFENTSVSESKHFLDLMHNVCLPSSSRDESNNHQNKNQTTCFQMPCVIELQDAGVKFEAVKNDNDGLNLNMFDIRFKHGHFKIPKFKVDDSTEIFFRNIIAYKQHSSDDKPKYFTDHMYLMDLLINYKEDVTQLHRHEVLENWLGDDEVVALMFNNLGNGKIIEEQFYYAEQCSKVNTHCKRWWNKVVASLKRDYFKNIWVIAAAFLLLLTFTQTVISLITILTSSPSLSPP
ncbi:UPF0481 protein At3g47200-like [Camellia sinensis]|uniref:UPF0481 protein At3g47200-like n=1 Tax=Camellia sinensis TaxID=4442 RepID=UPI0010367727|nr:UPF0481 protein At3g47200-like [Camellia sinensis]